MGDENEVSLEETCGLQLNCIPSKSKRIPIKWLQWGTTSPWMLTILCFNAFFQSFIITGLLYGSLTTLEYRFNLSGTESSLIASFSDIGLLTTLLLVTYIGGHGHKPSWIGWGMVLIAVGSVIFSLPHFVAEPHRVFATTMESDSGVSCNLNSSMETAACADLDGSSIDFRYLFCFATLLIGVGSAPLYTLGTTFIDENVSQINSALYHGVFFAMTLLGPGLGYIIQGAILSTYTDFNVPAPVTPGHPQFIGAWWLGFLICAFITLLTAIPLLLLPNHLPNTKELRENRQTEMQQTDNTFSESIQDSEFGKKFQDFPKCVAVLLRNPTFLLLTLAEMFDGVIATGLGAFLPKILETQFQLDPYFTAILVGFIVMLGGVIATFFGGFILSKLNLDVKGILKFCILFSVISLASCLIFLYSCENGDFAGINTFYDGGVSFGKLDAACNSDCGCSSLEFNPVCGSDGITHYSSCYAGCQGSLNGTHLNCGCIGDTIRTATDGYCNITCNHGGAAMFTVISFIASLVTFLYIVPTVQATIRSVPFSQRSFALGLQAMIYRVGFIAGPLVYGTALDWTCIYRGISCNGEYGYCSVYENSKVSRNVSMVTLISQGLVVVAYGLAFLLYKPVAEKTLGIDETPEPEPMPEPEPEPEPKVMEEWHDNPSYNEVAL